MLGPGRIDAKWRLIPQMGEPVGRFNGSLTKKAAWPTGLGRCLKVHRGKGGQALGGGGMA